MSPATVLLSEPEGYHFTTTGLMGEPVPPTIFRAPTVIRH